MTDMEDGETGRRGVRQRLPKLITLDFDGTLLDDSVWQPIIERTCGRVGREMGLDPTRLFAANADVWAEYWPAVADDWSSGRRDGASVTHEVWAKTLDRAGYDTGLAGAVAAAYLEERAAGLRLYPDATDALAALRGRVALGLITNGASDTQRAALDALGIEDQFSAVMISSEVGMVKPDPGIFRAAMAAVGAEPTDAWHVGDALETDIAGALAAGMTAVWVNRSGRPRQGDSPRPDLEIRSLLELAPRLSDKFPAMDRSTET